MVSAKATVDARRAAAHVLVAMQTDGAWIGALSRWYPDLMANLMAIGWLPATYARTQRYRRLMYRYSNSNSAGFLAVIRTESGRERLVWWGYAARTTRDTARVARIQVALVAADLGKIGITNPAIAGHMCRPLSPTEAVHV